MGRSQIRPFLYFKIRSERWAVLILALALLIGWELGVRLGRISPLFFPAPSVIFSTLIQLIQSGKLITHLGASLSRVLFGLLLGGLPGLLFGLIMGWSNRIRLMIDPLIAAIHPVPKIAILPLIMIFFGIGESSKVIVVAISTFFPMLINTMAGVRQIHPIHFEVAKNYGANLTRTFTRVIVPGSLPMILAGLRLAINIALLLTIAVELVTAQEGLGAMIWLAWQTLRTEELYVSLCMIAALGIFFNVILQRLMFQMIPWQKAWEP